MKLVPTAAPSTGSAPRRHARLEDAMALLTASLFVALGVTLFQTAGLLTGGTAGLAFLAHYGLGGSFGAWFFAINLPFYGFAWRRNGAEFTLKTLAVVALVSLASELMPRWIAIAQLDPLYAAVMGGSLVGCGLLMLFRHQASLGGLGILALWLQDRGRIGAGRFQMAVDAGILLAALAVADAQRVAVSIVGAVALNAVLALNHRPGRYAAAP